MASKRKDTKPTTRRLTAKQQAFIEHYTRHLNASDAMRHAYPAARKWTAKRVCSEAAKLLATPSISAIVQARAAKVAEIAEKEFSIDARSVLQRLAAIGFAEPGAYFAWGRKTITRRAKDGNEYQTEVDYVDITPSDQLSPVQKRAIVSVEMTTNKFGDTFQTLKLADPVKALVKLGEHLQLFNGKLDVVHSGAVTAQMVESDDLKRSQDPRDALKLFDQFRRQQLLPPPMPGKAN